MFPGASAPALDLLARMLQFDPRRRMTVQEALQHPYLSQLFGGEPAEPSAAEPFAFDFVEEELNAEAVKDNLWKEIQLYHAQA